MPSEATLFLGTTSKILFTDQDIQTLSYNGAVWNVDSTTTADKARLFASNTAVSPVLTGKPTLAEINTFRGVDTSVLIFYTGTNTSSDPPTHVYDVDASGNVTLIHKKCLFYSAQSTTYYQNTGLTSAIIDGMSISPLSGTYKVHFNTEFNTALANITAQGVIDLNALQSAVGGVSGAIAFPASTIYNAGVYTTAAAMSFTGTITLDGQGATNPKFIFRTTGGALTFAASCTFNLINGATSNNVFFQALGAITIGAGSSVSGTMIGNADITLNSGAFLNGRALTTAGLVTNTSGNITVPVLASPYPIGVLKNFAIFTSSGALSDTNVGIIQGDVGTNNGSITGFSSISGTVYPASQGSSLIKVSIYVDGVIQNASTRDRIDTVRKEEISTTAIITVGNGQVVTAQVINSIGISRFYNRLLTLLAVD
jgi:hypothetical protein